MLLARGAARASVVPGPQRIVAGLYAVAAADGDAAGTVVPGVSGIDDDRFVGSWPSRADAQALERVVGSLDDETPWERWIEASHVVASFDGDVGLTPLERALDDNLDALQAVCRAPRMLLRREEDRTPVSQARRISSRSIADLVSRPSDWEQRTLRGIRPARVLSVVSEDDWDLYENRVAARLVDRLLALLVQRLDQLTKMRGLLEEGHDFSDETRGSHWRVDRLARAWEHVEADDTVRAQVTATWRKVGALIDAVRALLGSPLYAKVPRSAQVDDALRPTNILSNDFHYRRVADLWRRAVMARARATPTRSEALRRRRVVSAHFDAFGRLLVLQALAGFGYRPTASTARFCDGPMRLQGPRGELVLRAAEHGALTLHQGERVLPIVALPIEPGGDAAAVVAAITRDADEALFFLHGRVGATPTASGSADEVTAVFAGWSRPRALLVSPWSLDAIERTARVLGGWDAAGRLERFPPRVAWRGAPPEGMPDWARVQAGALVVTRPPRGAEQSEFTRALAQRAVTVQRGQDTARQRGTPFDGREGAVLTALQALLDGSASIGWLARCPVCEGSAVRFEPRWQEGVRVEQQTVWARCEGCASQWGLQACGRCESGRFAALEPGVNLECPTDVVRLDRTYGRDLWSRPRRGAEGRGEFACPRCATG
jgi:hypothetical protein